MSGALSQARSSLGMGEDRPSKRDNLRYVRGGAKLGAWSDHSPQEMDVRLEPEATSFILSERVNSPRSAPRRGCRPPAPLAPAARPAAPGGGRAGRSPRRKRCTYI